MRTATVIAEGVAFRLDFMQCSQDRELHHAGNLDVLETVANSKYARIAWFSSHFPPFKDWAYILVWQDDSDLIELERKIANGSYNDEDFSHAFRTEYHELKCRQCGEKSGALVIDPGDPYPGNTGLHRQKIARLNVKVCPFCKSSFGQLVVKVLGTREQLRKNSDFPVGSKNSSGKHGDR